ncbi:MAG: glycosyltransferase [Selenomonadaceae bacterium]|nr:glycosyltransferase [Selenomonadaceae bacterium]
MKLAIFENIMTPGGHEVDFDRILVEEFRALGHEVSFYVPEDFVFSFDYHVPVHRLDGQAVSYTKVRGVQKLLAAARRELNRQKWYRQLYRAARRQEMDAIIVPTSTYRYLRALNWNSFKKSPVPVVFVLHGINPGEAPRFLRETEKLLAYPNIRMAVLTFQDHIFGKRLPNIYPLYPPTYTARDLAMPLKERAQEDVLTIGFFGQYRKEKRLEDFLEVFLQGRYERPVKLLVQGSTMHPADGEDFERIRRKYQEHENVEFLHKGLIGREWQEAIAKVDALLMPYSAPRYRYHWGGMLFTAIGFQKPVIASDDINPEVFEKFRIGETFPSGDMDALRAALEHFINGFEAEAGPYRSALQEAAALFSPQAFAKRMERLLQREVQGIDGFA